MSYKLLTLNRNNRLKRVCTTFCGLVLGAYLYGTPPSNDSFSRPTVINNFPVTLSASNVEATLQTSSYEQPPHSGEASIWFKWAAETSESVQVDTLGSDFNTVLAVWLDGTVLNALDQVASNDDAAGGKQSLVTFDAVAGTTYLISVYGYIGNTGNVALTLKPEGDTTRIAGNVTASDGVTPLPGIEVSTLGQNNAGYWVPMGEAVSTANDGSYAIKGLLAGKSYKIWAYDPVGNYIPGSYVDANGAEIEVSLPAPDSTVSDIDISLEVNGKVSGKVIQPDGSPISGIRLGIFHLVADQWEPYEDIDPLSSVDTATDGTYTLSYLRAGTYRILFSGGRVGSVAYRSEYYNDAATIEAAQDIVITNQSSQVTGVDATLGNLPAPEVIDFSRTAPSQYTARVRVESGYSYRLLSSLDLYQWLANRHFIADSDEEVLIIDSDESEFPERFWRIDIAH